MTYVNDDATTPSRDLRVGPLASHLDSFEIFLGGQGYVPASVRQKIELLSGFSAWAERNDVPLVVLGEEHAGLFLTEYRRRTRRGDAWTIRQLIRYLRGSGCLPAPMPKVDLTAKGELIGAFEGFLRTERGLSASTLTNYLPIVRRFLDEQFGGEGLDFDNLRAVDVHRFIVRRAQAGSPRRAKLVVTALRTQETLERADQFTLGSRIDLSASAPAGSRCRAGIGSIAGWSMRRHVWCDGDTPSEIDLRALPRARLAEHRSSPPMH